MDTEIPTIGPVPPPAVPVPIGTIYMHGDGNFSVQSSLASPRDLARVLSELTSSIIGQLANPPVTPAVIDSAGGGEAA